MAVGEDKTSPSASKTYISSASILSFWTPIKPQGIHDTSFDFWLCAGWWRHISRSQSSEIFSVILMVHAADMGPVAIHTSTRNQCELMRLVRESSGVDCACWRGMRVAVIDLRARKNGAKVGSFIIFASLFCRLCS